MDINHKELSLKFYNFLCGIIGTPEVVAKRRQTFSLMDDGYKLSGLNSISSGSKAEGLEIKGSDFDVMFVFTGIPVFERIEEHNTDKRLFLLMDTENIKPGFTKFLVHNQENSFFPSYLIDMRTGSSYLSSTLFRDDFYDHAMSVGLRCYIHGPCTTIDGKGDIAISFHCTKWIAQALPWTIRSKYSWASDKVIRNILSFGVLFVPIGSKSSPIADLEWRISFSYAEKQLIFCFNHVQLMCYALLKVLLTDIIKKTFGDLLCSYFMKTIMFWLCEETEMSYWRAENILSCFMTCFKRLIYCVENKTCLHYFIPENNLFENRFESHHEELMSTLKGLYDLGWPCLIQTETLWSFRSYMNPSFSSNLSFSTYFESLYYLHNIVETGFDYSATVKMGLYKILRSKKARDITMFLLSRSCQFLAQKSSNDESVQVENKYLYHKSRQRLLLLLIGLNHDAVSGWLLLASFFFKSKQYIKAKILIEHCFTKFTSKTCSLIEENRTKLSHFNQIQKMIGQKCLKNYAINFVKFKDFSYIIPEELKLLANKNVGIDIPSWIYAHFLIYIFYHRVGNDNEKRKCYRNLSIICNQPLVVTSREKEGTMMCVAIAQSLRLLRIFLAFQ